MSKRKDATSQERARVRRLIERQHADELTLTPGFQSDDSLKAVLKLLPHGLSAIRKARTQWPFRLLRKLPLVPRACRSARADGVVCANGKSPRAGLLTFEHQWRPQYEWDNRSDYLDTRQGKKEQQRFQTWEDYLDSWRNAHTLVPCT
jgi:hypothetical protein